MDQHVSNLAQWSDANRMIVNHNKTKEMILGRPKNHSPPTLTIEGRPIECVSSFKLLGVQISNDLCWENHVQAICTKANSKLYFLKMLKRAGLSTGDLVCFYTTVIRPVLEYASVVWHHGLTQAQADRLEALQKRALRIIYGQVLFGMPYQFMLIYAGIISLSQRRAKLGQSFFDKISEPTDCINYLLPSGRDHAIVSRLRHAPKYEHSRTRTSRYRSFVHYALSNYQK